MANILSKWHYYFNDNTLLLCTLQWRHNERDGVSNHQPYDCLLNRLFRRGSKKTPKLRATGLCAGNSPVTGEFPAQRTSNAETISIWWRHHELRDSLAAMTILSDRDTMLATRDINVSIPLRVIIPAKEIWNRETRYKNATSVENYPDSTVHGANMGPTWVLSALDRPHVGPMNLAIRVIWLHNAVKGLIGALPC